MVFNYANAKELTVTEQNSIENSISTISTTPYATAPFMRSMGIKDYPPETNSIIAKNQYAMEVISQTAMWEDRAKVTAVNFGDDNEVRMVIEYG